MLVAGSTCFLWAIIIPFPGIPGLVVLINVLHYLLYIIILFTRRNFIDLIWSLNPSLHFTPLFAMYHCPLLHIIDFSLMKMYCHHFITFYFHMHNTETSEGVRSSIAFLTPLFNTPRKKDDASFLYVFAFCFAGQTNATLLYLPTFHTFRLDHCYWTHFWIVKD